MIISLSSSQNVADRHTDETKQIFYVQEYFVTNIYIYEIMWKRLVEL